MWMDKSDHLIHVNKEHMQITFLYKHFNFTFSTCVLILNAVVLYFDLVIPCISQIWKLSHSKSKLIDIQLSVGRWD